MSSIQVEKDSIPLSVFRTSYKECIENIKEGKRSIVLTQNGKAAAVLLSPCEYDELREQQKVMNLIASRLQEIANQTFVADEAAMWEELEL